ncbi:hypothetical protein TgHK011_006359 [Trichoderma gracile]|nr:hypothetical protein TgHK011_006359 [Trichoderma gracile]
MLAVIVAEEVESESHAFTQHKAGDSFPIIRLLSPPPALWAWLPDSSTYIKSVQGDPQLAALIGTLGQPLAIHSDRSARILYGPLCRLDGAEPDCMVPRGQWASGGANVKSARKIQGVLFHKHGLVASRLVKQHAGRLSI